jgi:competence protein ComEC
MQFFERYIGQTASAILAVPVVAQLGCYPILLLMNSYITPYAPLANILVTLAVEPATLLSLLACLLAPINPTISYAVAKISAFFTDIVADVALWVNNLPFAKIEWIPGVLGGALLAVLVALFFLSPTGYRYAYAKITGYAPREATSFFTRTLTKGRKLRAKWLQKALRRPLIPIALAVVLISTVGAFHFAKVRLNWFTNIPADWIIAACDVGQGDAGVVRTGAHSGVLIDVGPKDGNISSCLSKLGITSLDMLVLSHYHDDHIGALNEAIAGRDVGIALVDAVKQPESGVNQVDKALNAKHVQQINAENGMSGQFGCQASAPYCVKWQVVSEWDDNGEDGALSNGGQAMQSRNSSKATEEDNRENDSSIAMLFEVNGVTYFTAGDLETDGNKGALRELRRLNIHDVAVVKVNHHGSKTQSKPLMQQLNPLVAIYMVGKNSYGHPNKDTIDYYEQLGATTLRTDKMGICGVVLHKNGMIDIFSSKER